jgi:hypothetical protein
MTACKVENRGREVNGAGRIASLDNPKTYQKSFFGL